MLLPRALRPLLVLTASESVCWVIHEAGYLLTHEANPRKGAHVRDAHTKGPRGNRPARNYTSGGHTPSGTGSTRGPRTPASGGERRQFERRSGTLPDSQKKVEAGWGADEGNAELTGARGDP